MSQFAGSTPLPKIAGQTTIVPEDAYALHEHVTSRRGLVNLPDEQCARLATGPAAAG
jgi:hypothetical protein